MESDAIVVPIKGDVKNFEAGVEKAKKELSDFEKATETITQAVNNKWNQCAAGVTLYAGAFQAVKGAIDSFVIAPLAGAVNNFVSFGDDFAKTAQRIGIGAESLGGLKFAAEQCGADFDTMTDSVKTFQEQLGAAKLGDAGAIGKLGDVGIKAEDFEGLSVEKQFMKLADHIASIGDRAEQTRTAIELFGDAGFKLLPFFQEGSAGIRKLMDEGKDIGAVLGEDAANGAASLGDAMNRMKTSFANISLQIVSHLAPALTTFFNAMSAVISGTIKWVKWSTPFLTALAEMAAGFGIVTAAYMLYGAKANLAAIATANLGKAFAALAANPWVLGITLAAAALAGMKVWLDQCAESTYKLSDAGEKYRENVEKNLKADEEHIDRLKELEALSKDGPLNNSEVEEANRLIGDLNDVYGDLGITIHETTGKIEGMTGAQKKFNEEANKQRIAALETYLKSAEANQTVRQQQADDLRNKWTMWGNWSFTDWMAGGKERDMNSASAIEAEIGKEGLNITSAQTELNRLKGLAKPAVEADPNANISTAELTKKNKADREAQAKAAEELTKFKPDTDFMEPLEKAFFELAEKVQQKYAELGKKIAAAESAGNRELAENLKEQYGKIADWETKEREKITQGETKRQADETAKQYDEWKKAHPELVSPVGEDVRLSGAKGKVESAKSARAEAVLSGDRDALAKTTAELKAAELELAKTVATVSGTDRTNARKALNDAQAEYDARQKAGADNATLNALAEKITKARDTVDKADSEYYAAVAQVESAAPPKEAEVKAAAEAVITSSQGTFSAYGLDALTQNNIPQETLDWVKKAVERLTNIDEKNVAAFTN